MSEQDSTRTSQNVVIRFLKNWVGFWHRIAVPVKVHAKSAAPLIGVSLGGAVYLSLPTLAYTYYQYGWEAFLTTGEYKINGLHVLILTVAWILLTVSIGYAAFKTYEGDSDE